MAAEPQSPAARFGPDRALAAWRRALRKPPDEPEEDDGKMIVLTGHIQPRVKTADTAGEKWHRKRYENACFVRRVNSGRAARSISRV
jgi:hypothetical protein